MLARSAVSHLGNWLPRPRKAKSASRTDCFRGKSGTGSCANRRVGAHEHRTFITINCTPPTSKHSHRPFLPMTSLSTRRSHSNQSSRGKEPASQEDHHHHDGGHGHSHSHSIFGAMSHSHGPGEDGHGHDAEQIVQALKGGGT